MCELPLIRCTIKYLFAMRQKLLIEETVPYRISNNFLVSETAQRNKMHNEEMKPSPFLTYMTSFIHNLWRP